jgi:hypothetical protein
MNSVVILNGLSIIGSIVNPVDATAFGFHSVKLLSGEYDRYIKAIGLHQMTGKIFEKDEELETPEVLKYVERIKQMVRNMIQGMFEQEAEHFKQQQKHALEALKIKLSQSNKPHEQGTVTEIAKKLGVSKSEVRRLKAENKLDEALAALH